MKHWLVQLGAMAAGIALSATAASADIVVPGDLADMEANEGNSFPFNIAMSGFDSQRYQQVYDASEFGMDPLSISGLMFRPDTLAGDPFDSMISNVEIRLSTTPQPVDGLSLTFANNIGADEITVFSGPLSLSSADTGSALPAMPRDFDIGITFDTAFTYDPTLGNLLLDISVFESASTTAFDAAFVGGDTTSRVFTTISGAASPTADMADVTGLVTKFVTTDVPEPGGLTLLAIGLAGLGFARRRFRA